MIRAQDLITLLALDPENATQIIRQNAQKLNPNCIVTFNELGIKYGDLGNQLFQFSAVIAFAKLHNIKAKIPNPNSEYYKEKGIKLNCFNIPKELYTDKPVIDCFPLGEISHELRGTTGNQFMFINPIAYPSDIQIPQAPRNLNLRGWYQNWILAEYIKPELKKYLSFNDDVKNKAKNLLKKINENYPGDKIVAVHVRLGDLLREQSQHRYFPAPKDYYKRSFKRAKEEYGKKVKFLMISDEPEKCKKLFDDPAIIYADQFTATKVNNSVISYENQDAAAFFSAEEDLCIMTICDSVIISASTFSWWGAFLGKHEHVWAPVRSKWYGLLNNFKNLCDLYPPDWEEVWFKEEPPKKKFDLKFLLEKLPSA